LAEKGYCVAETLLSVAILSVLGKPERLGQTKCIWNNQFSKFLCSFMHLFDSNWTGVGPVSLNDDDFLAFLITTRSSS
jgi:hypothetical protein